MKQSKIDRLTKYYMEQEGMTARKLKNRLTKEMEQEDRERSQKPVKSLTISIEWRRSQMWGMNPHAEASVYFKDGTFERNDGYTAGGYGYDKESTVIAHIFNEYLRYKLWQREDMDNSKAPYGVSLTFDWSPSFGWGVGTSCYYAIAEFIGGKFEDVTHGKTFDVYKFTMDEGE